MVRYMIYKLDLQRAPIETNIINQRLHIKEINNKCGQIVMLGVTTLDFTFSVLYDATVKIELSYGDDEDPTNWTEPAILEFKSDDTPIEVPNGFKDIKLIGEDIIIDEPIEEPIPEDLV